MKRILLIHFVVALVSMTLSGRKMEQEKFPFISGPYLGQKSPGMTAEIFAPGIISTKDYEHGAPAFSPDGKDRTMYFAPWKGEGLISGHVYSSDLRGGVYQKPEHLGSEINAETYQAYPYIPPDGRFMIFESQRIGSYGSDDLYISFHKKDGGWTKAVNMGKSINSKASERCPAVTPDGKYLFFISNRSGNYDYYWVDARIIDSLRPKNMKGT